MVGNHQQTSNNAPAFKGHSVAANNTMRVQPRLQYTINTAAKVRRQACSPQPTPAHHGNNNQQSTVWSVHKINVQHGVVITAHQESPMLSTVNKHATTTNTQRQQVTTWSATPQRTHHVDGMGSNNKITCLGWWERRGRQLVTSAKVGIHRSVAWVGKPGVYVCVTAAIRAVVNVKPTRPKPNHNNNQTNQCKKGKCREGKRGKVGTVGTTGTTTNHVESEPVPNKQPAKPCLPCPTTQRQQTKPMPVLSNLSTVHHAKCKMSVPTCPKQRTTVSVWEGKGEGGGGRA